MYNHHHHRTSPMTMSGVSRTATAYELNTTNGSGGVVTAFASTAAVAAAVSDTDTESSAPPVILKRPILIRGDVEFLKSFPSATAKTGDAIMSASFNNESTYYSPDNRTIEVYITYKD